MSDSETTNPGGINSLISRARKANSAIANLNGGGPAQGQGVALEIDLDLLDPNPKQPRRIYDPDAMEDLKASIKLYRVMQPITVTAGANGRYITIAGHRRVEALRSLRDAATSDAEKARYSKVPASDLGPTEQLAELAITENLQRDDMRPVETAEALAALKDERKFDSADQVAKHLGLDPTRVKRYLQLASAPEGIRTALTKGIMVEVGDKTPGGKPRKEHRTLELEQGLLVLRAYQYWNATKPKKAAELARALVDKVLEEGWTRKRLKDHVDGLKGKGDAPQTDDAGQGTTENADAGGASKAATKDLFASDENKFVVYRSRLANASDEQRTALKTAIQELLSQLN